MKTLFSPRKHLRVLMSLSILFSLTFHFVSAQDLNPSSWPNMKGYWKFQDTTQLVKATVGNDLFLVGSHEWVQGPNYGDTAARIAIGSYYKCYHNIPSNGGGDSVNQYSLMFDFKVLNFDRWHTFHQTDSTNMNDGECFIKPQSPGLNKSTFGTATTGYTQDSIIPNEWYRMVISVNLGTHYRYYINGNLWHDTNNQVVDGRFALTPLLLFFADNNQEDDTIDIASLAIFDTCLTSAQVASIGSLDPCIANPPYVNLGADTTLCMEHNLTLDAGSGFKSYLWSTADTTRIIVLDSNSWGNGTSAVWVRTLDMNDCEASDTIVVSFVDCSGINANDKTNFKVFPNPCYDEVNLWLPQGEYCISIQDVCGKIVLKSSVVSQGNARIPLSQIPRGVYILSIRGENQFFSQKIIKQ